MQNEQIIYDILQIEAEEIRRKQENKLLSYNKGKKIHKKQIAFHKCKKRNRWVFGGNRTGKTECGAVEAIYIARGIHPYRQNKKDVFGWVVSLSQQVQRDVAQRKILQYLPPEWIVDITMLSGKKGSSLGTIDQIQIRNIFGGISTIGFKSCDQGREKFQGASLDFVWFDEEPPEDIYFECRMRIVDKNGDIFGTMTPLKGMTFLYNTIYMNQNADKEIWYQFIEWKDNPFLDKKEIALLEKTLYKKMLESRQFGRFNIQEGLVYPEFNENIHVIAPFAYPLEWQDMISIDPGLHNPLSAHWYCQDYDGNIYVVAEHYMAEQDIDYHAEQLHLISNKLQWHRESNGNLNALIDSAAGQRTLANSKSVSELFYDRGINVNMHINKDLFSGIAKVKSYLNGKGPKLYIFSCCVNLIREFKGYFWGQGERPIKRDDHALDELRYYLMTKQCNTKTVFQTRIEKDKQRLLKANKYSKRSM